MASARCHLPGPSSQERCGSRHSETGPDKLGSCRSLDKSASTCGFLVLQEVLSFRSTPSRMSTLAGLVFLWSWMKKHWENTLWLIKVTNLQECHHFLWHWSNKKPTYHKIYYLIPCVRFPKFHYGSVFVSHVLQEVYSMGQGRRRISSS